MSVQLEVKIKRRGHNKEEGQRLPYVVTDIGCKGKQSEKIESVEYFKAHSKVLKLDYGYYIERLIEPLVKYFKQFLKIVKKRKQFIQIIFKKQNFFLFLKKEANIHKLIYKRIT